MFSLAEKSVAFLVSCNGIGQKSISQLTVVLEKEQISWLDFWCEKEILWKKCGLKDAQIDNLKQRLSEEDLESYANSLLQKKIRVITVQSEEYPPLLKTIENTPIVLFARGSPLDWSAGVPVAVVGTRHMTQYGKDVTEKITSELVWCGAQIVSGFMYGVDSCAHRAALESGGKTVGVLGFGFNHMYPKSHKKFFEECLENGMTFITPFAPDVGAHAGNFPARNAIVAGMSAALVVTEAAEKSGTHITAEYAADFGRPVCAVPGSIFSPYSSGTKWLVNQGATLVQSGEEVMQELAEDTQIEKFTNSGDLEVKMYDYFLIHKEALSENIQESFIDYSNHEICTVLLSLEMKEKIIKKLNKWILVT